MTDEGPAASGAEGRPSFELAAPPGPHHVSGTVRVANEVVASIAAFAALEVRGVHGLHSGGQQLERILHRPASQRGVRVRLRDGGTLVLDLWIAMTAGLGVSAVGGEVQARVASVVERMLGMPVAEVNVHVGAVVFP